MRNPDSGGTTKTSVWGPLQITRPTAVNRVSPNEALYLRYLLVAAILGTRQASKTRPVASAVVCALSESGDHPRRRWLPP